MFGTRLMTMGRYGVLLKQNQALGFGGMPSMKQQWQKFLGIHSGGNRMDDKAIQKAWSLLSMHHSELLLENERLRKELRQRSIRAILKERFLYFFGKRDD
jgi:hypothetical protein